MMIYLSFRNNKDYIDSIITTGFEEIFTNKTTKSIKGKNDTKQQRKRSKNKKKNATRARSRKGENTNRI